MPRWPRIGAIGFVGVVLAALVVPVTSGAAATSRGACKLLTKAQAGVLLGLGAETSILTSHFGKSECLYFPINPSGTSSASEIVITEETGSKAVQDFYRMGNPRNRVRVEGPLPTRVSAQEYAKEFRPHPFRLGGDPAYYLGPITGTHTVTFRSLADGVVIMMGVPSGPATPISLGKRAMAEALGNLKHQPHRAS